MDIIKEIAKSLDLGYQFGTYREINALFDRHDKTELPAVCELMALKGSFDLKFESAKDNQSVCLLFLDLDQKQVKFFSMVILRLSWFIYAKVKTFLDLYGRKST